MVLISQVVHDGLNCKQYQDRMNSDSDGNEEAKRTGDMLSEMIAKGEALKCPVCQVRITRSRILLPMRNNIIKIDDSPNR